MPRLDYKNCRACGGHVSEVGLLSHTRLCRTCAIGNVSANIVGMKLKTEPALARWRKGMVASVGGVLLDDTAERA